MILVRLIRCVLVVFALAAATPAAALTPEQVGSLASSDAGPRMEALNAIAPGIALAQALAGLGAVDSDVDLSHLPLESSRRVGELVGPTEALLKAARRDRFEALYIVAVTGGMRLGELFGLHWSDIDFKGRAIMVQHAFIWAVSVILEALSSRSPIKVLA